MYLDHTESEPKIVPAPDPKAGLWICPRRKAAEPIKVSIPADCLAFQTGEALQLLTGGKLAATPHFVRAGQDASSVSRETFAFFLQ
jgi:isopenicillin N synthase-like dioxygenase